MRKGLMPMVLLCMVLAGCGTESSRPGEEPETERMPQEVEGEQDMAYTAQEITVQNGDLQIYGIAYVPEAKDKHRW